MAKNILDDEKDYSALFNNNKTKIYYNFCYNLHDNNGCDKNNPAQVSAFEDGNCTKLTSSIKTGNTWSVNSSFIEIEMNQPSGSKYVTKYQILCDKNATGEPKLIPENSYYNKEKDGKYETLLYFRSDQGCAISDFYVFWAFINEYDWIFAIILIVAGLFECILGNKKLKVTAFVISCAAAVIVFVIFFVQFILPPGCKFWIIWVILFIALVIGIFAGYFVAQHKEKILALILGGVSGFFLGQLLFNLFGNRFGENLLLVNIIFIVVCIVVLVLLTFILHKLIFIFSTSLIGAYATIRGVSFFAGGFPSEFTIMDLASSGEKEQLAELLDWPIYVYLSSIVILTGLSMYIQFKICSDESEGGKLGRYKDADGDDNLI